MTRIAKAPPALTVVLGTLGILFAITMAPIEPTVVAPVYAAILALWCGALLVEFGSPLDPRFLAAAGFLAYLALAPLGPEVSYGGFPFHVYEKAYRLVILAGCGFMLSSIFWKRTDRAHCRLDSDTTGWFEAPLIYMLFGYGLLFLDTSRVGGPIASLSIKKIDRMTSISEQYGNLPFDTLINVGALVMCHFALLEKDPTRRRRLWIALACALLPYLAFRIVQGERSSLIKTLVPILALLFKQSSLRLSVRPVIALVLTFVSFSLLGNIRGAITYSLRDRSLAPITQRLGQFNASWLYPREFSASYFSLTGSLQLEDLEETSRLEGESYVQAIPNLLPRTLYPGQKPKTIAHEFGDKIAKRVGRDRRFGVGFSPVAEAYLNFGELGVTLVFLAFGFVLSVYAGLADVRSHFLRHYFFLTLPGMLLFYRSGFASIVSYHFETLVVLSLLHVLHEVIRLSLRPRAIA